MASAWGLSWGQSWGNSWGAVSGITTVTDTDILQKPVDYVMHGDQVIRDRYRTADVRAPNLRGSTRVTRSGPRKLGGSTGFTTRTDNRGYD